MALLTSLVLDGGMIVADLAKRRGRTIVCRHIALFAIINMLAFYLTEGLREEFGASAFFMAETYDAGILLLDAVCAVTAKIFTVWTYVWGYETAGNLWPAYLWAVGVSLCVHGNPFTGILCEVLLLWGILYAERAEGLGRETEEPSSGSGGNSLYLRTIEESYRKNRELMHDLNNHAVAMHALAVHGEYEELVRYIDTFSQKVNDNLFPVHSGNIVLDALLADKYHRAARMDIPVLFQGVQYRTDMDNEDLCTIIGNLFDNAIEENRRWRGDGRRGISVCILSDEDSLRVTVKNPLFHEVRAAGGLPVSEKPDMEHHGMGLRNVRRVCGKYGGAFYWGTAEGEFTAMVVINGIRRTG